jgi:hypothetical protein
MEGEPTTVVACGNGNTVALLTPGAGKIYMGRLRHDKPGPVDITQAAVEMHALPSQIW